MKWDPYAICDLCGKKCRRSEVKRITDKYNLNYGLVLCPKDAAEKTNAQNYPGFPWRESVLDPKLIRPEVPAVYNTAINIDDVRDGTSSESVGTTGSAPLNVYIASKSASEVRLQWFAPNSLGNRHFLGWAVKRESPIGGGFSDLTTNSGSVDMGYTDSTVSSSTEYNYKVAVVTTAGTGTFSDTIAVTTL